MDKGMPRRMHAFAVCSGGAGGTRECAAYATRGDLRDGGRRRGAMPDAMRGDAGGSDALQRRREDLRIELPHDPRQCVERRLSRQLPDAQRGLHADRLLGQRHCEVLRSVETVVRCSPVGRSAMGLERESVQDQAAREHGAQGQSEKPCDLPLAHYDPHSIRLLVVRAPVLVHEAAAVCLPSTLC